MIHWWRRGVSLIVLFVLAGAPAVAAVCAELCALQAANSAPAHHASPAAHHHAAMPGCHESPGTTVAASAQSAHPCDDHAALDAGAASLTAGRADARLLCAAQARASVMSTTHAALLVPMRGPDGHAIPPRPTASPLALRI